jgi:hypothetical protein
MFAKLKKTLARSWLAQEIKDLGRAIEEADRGAAVALRYELELRTQLDNANKTVAILTENAKEGRIARQQRLNQLNEALALAVDRLELIASKETAGANGSVRRMARIAREAVVEVSEAAKC